MEKCWSAGLKRWGSHEGFWLHWTNMWVSLNKYSKYSDYFSSNSNTVFPGLCDISERSYRKPVDHAGTRLSWCFGSVPGCLVFTLSTFAYTNMYILNESVHKSSDKDDIRIPGTYCIHWELKMWGCWLMRKKKNPESPVCIWKLKDPLLSITLDRVRLLNTLMRLTSLLLFS